MSVLLSVLPDVPALSATLRCVPDEYRSVAMALQWIIVRCLGFIPGPIIFGAVIDEACLFWKESCDDETGACYYYDNTDLSNYFLGMSLGCKSLALAFFVLSWLLYKPPPATDVIKDNKADGPTSGSGVSNPSFINNVTSQ